MDILKKVLVTGASGFIGSRVASHLGARGYEVFGMVRGAPIDKPGFRTVRGDLTDRSSLEAACRGVDCVIHCAGLVHNPSAGYDRHRAINVEGSVSLMLEAARAGAKQFIFMSSIAAYGKGTGLWRESDECKPHTPYGRAKLEAEETLSAIAEREGLDLVVLRLSTVYGEGDKGNVRRLIAAVDRFGPVIFGTGKNLKSMTYVSNIAELCDLLLVREADRRSRLYNVSDPEPYTLENVVMTISRVLGQDREPVYVSKWLALLGSHVLTSLFSIVSKNPPVTPAQVQTLTEDAACDCTKLKKELGFEAPILLKEGIGITAAWYKQVSGSARVRAAN